MTITPPMHLLMSANMVPTGGGGGTNNCVTKFNNNFSTMNALAVN